VQVGSYYFLLSLQCIKTEHYIKLHTIVQKSSSHFKLSETVVESLLSQYSMNKLATKLQIHSSKNISSQINNLSIFINILKYEIHNYIYDSK